MAVKIQVRRDTAANWTSTDPVLSAGEFGFETDTGYLKVGDGSTAWTVLGYVDTNTDAVASVNSQTGTVVLDSDDIAEGATNLYFNGKTTDDLTEGSTNLYADANATNQGNTFNGADQLVQLNGTGQLPALDGSNLTNVSSVASIDDLTDVDTTTVAPSTNDVLTWDGSQWEPAASGGGGEAEWEYLTSIEDTTDTLYQYDSIFDFTSYDYKIVMHAQTTETDGSISSPYIQFRYDGTTNVTGNEYFRYEYSHNTSGSNSDGLGISSSNTNIPFLQNISYLSGSALVMQSEIIIRPALRSGIDSVDVVEESVTVNALTRVHQGNTTGTGGFGSTHAQGWCQTMARAGAGSAGRIIDGFILYANISTGEPGSETMSIYIYRRPTDKAV